ncbi:hypothetical protein JZ751_012755 [Albula glossodonta]|uniref:Uncharacterized protein n=1 Tax=Albula glossodonta TaxID=121402 RepID=A0A8T2N0G3_9TELE|nr:hypothetical protein JZ751_012755 [Albula glossodonta]
MLYFGLYLQRLTDEAVVMSWATRCTFVRSSRPPGRQQHIKDTICARLRIPDKQTIPEEVKRLLVVQVRQTQRKGEVHRETKGRLKFKKRSFMEKLLLHPGTDVAVSCCATFQRASIRLSVGPGDMDNYLSACLRMATFWCMCVRGPNSVSESPAVEREHPRKGIPEDWGPVVVFPFTLHSGGRDVGLGAPLVCSWDRSLRQLSDSSSCLRTLKPPRASAGGASPGRPLLGESASVRLGAFRGISPWGDPEMERQPSLVLPSLCELPLPPAEFTLTGGTLSTESAFLGNGGDLVVLCLLLHNGSGEHARWCIHRKVPALLFQELAQQAISGDSARGDRLPFYFLMGGRQGSESLTLPSHCAQELLGFVLAVRSNEALIPWLSLDLDFQRSLIFAGIAIAAATPPGADLFRLTPAIVGSLSLLLVAPRRSCRTVRRSKRLSISEAGLVVGGVSERAVPFLRMGAWGGSRIGVPFLKIGALSLSRRVTDSGGGTGQEEGSIGYKETHYHLSPVREKTWVGTENSCWTAHCGGSVSWSPHTWRQQQLKEGDLVVGFDRRASARLFDLGHRLLVSLSNVEEDEEEEEEQEDPGSGAATLLRMERSIGEQLEQELSASLLSLGRLVSGFEYSLSDSRGELRLGQALRSSCGSRLLQFCGGRAPCLSKGRRSLNGCGVLCGEEAPPPLLCTGASGDGLGLLEPSAGGESVVCFPFREVNVSAAT